MLFFYIHTQGKTDSHQKNQGKAIHIRTNFSLI